VFLLDVSIVLAAHRDDHPQHRPVRAWFDGMLAGDEPFAVPQMVWAAFLRLTTNPRIFDIPTPRAEAFAFVEATRAQPLHLPVAPGPRHLAILRRLCDEGDALGELVAAASIGAVAVEYACELVTLDRDFARFASVRRTRPAGV
jgi:toxin-antitoxin system PIN domain toxin